MTSASNTDRFRYITSLNDSIDLVLDTENRSVCRRKRMTCYDRQVFSELSDHTNPHIPRILSFEENEKGAVVIEEQIEGKTLSAILETNRLSSKTARAVFLQLMDAVEFLHGLPSPVIHRDIKPDNIMITPEGTIVLCDYDAARIPSRKQSRDTVLIGTEGYAAPEQYGFAESSERTDLYALGKIASLLFPQKKYFIERACAMDPKERFSSVKEMRKAFLISRNLYSWIPFNPHDPKDILCFLLLLTLCIGIPLVSEFSSRGQSAVQSSVERICEAGLFLSLLILYRRWTPLFKNVLWLRDSRPWVRIPAYALFTFLIFMLWAVPVSIAI
jgi:serine/threonine protein kinase